MIVEWWTGGHIAVRRESPWNDPTGWDTFYAVKLRLYVGGLQYPAQVLWVSRTDRRPKAEEAQRHLKALS